MKRTALLRRTPLARGTAKLTTRKPLRTKTRLRQVTKDERRRELRFRRQYGTSAYIELLTSLPCVECNRRPVDPSHVRSRGAGGRWHQQVPHCREHHDAWEQYQDRTEAKAAKLAGIALYLAQAAHSIGLVEAPPAGETCDPPPHLLRALGDALLGNRLTKGASNG